MLLNELIAISPENTYFMLSDETGNNLYKNIPEFTKSMKVWRLRPVSGGYSVTLRFRGDLSTPCGRVDVLGITTYGKLIIDDGETKLLKITECVSGFYFYYKRRKYYNSDVIQF